MIDQIWGSVQDWSNILREWLGLIQFLWEWAKLGQEQVGLVSFVFLSSEAWIDQMFCESGGEWELKNVLMNTLSLLSKTLLIIQAKRLCLLTHTALAFNTYSKLA